MIRIALAVICFAASAAQAQLQVGQSDFIYSSELMSQGFEPFSTSGVGQSLYGLRRGNALYLCFLADQPDFQETRQQTIMAQISGEAEARTVPNVPVVCVLTQ